MNEPEFVTLEDGVLLADESWYHNQNGAPQPPVPFTGLSHAEVLKLEFPAERMLIDNLVPIGAVGTIAGVPETYKSWQAQRIANVIATGEGDIFGHAAIHSGPVGYFWQDDSTREEAERIKLYHAVHGNDTTDIPIRWFLNEGLQLPDHCARLRTTIVTHGFVLVVLDSFYNILFGRDLKDDEAERVIAELKTLICDTTGCTVLIVDHMPWATEQNRKRLRAYGGVFKGAAIRFGIYLDAVGNKLFAEARGNNIAGFKRQLAEWDPDALELKLIDTTDAVSGEEYEQRILAYLTDHPNARTEELDAITGTKSHLTAARKRLLSRNQLVRERGRTSYKGFTWNLSNHAGSTSSTDETNQLDLPNWFGGSTSSPLRGDELAELVDPSPEPTLDDDIPF